MTKTQSRSRREDLRATRLFKLARKRKLEIDAIIAQATQALEDGHKPDPGMNEKTGIHWRDAAPPGRQPNTDNRISLQSINGNFSQRISRKSYVATVARLGFRVARHLAFNTAYFTTVWPAPYSEDEAAIMEVTDPAELDKYGL